MDKPTTAAGATDSESLVAAGGRRKGRLRSRSFRISSSLVGLLVAGYLVPTVFELIEFPSWTPADVAEKFRESVIRERRDLSLGDGRISLKVPPDLIAFRNDPRFMALAVRDEVNETVGFELPNIEIVDVSSMGNADEIKSLIRDSEGRQILEVDGTGPELSILSDSVFPISFEAEAGKDIFGDKGIGWRTAEFVTAWIVEDQTGSTWMFTAEGSTRQYRDEALGLAEKVFPSARVTANWVAAATPTPTQDVRLLSCPQDMPFLLETVDGRVCSSVSGVPSDQPARAGEYCGGSSPYGIDSDGDGMFEGCVSEAIRTTLPVGCNTPGDVAVDIDGDGVYENCCPAGATKGADSDGDGVMDLCMP